MIPIVFSTDHNYVMPTGITILSLLLSNPDSTFDIFVLCSPDVDANDRQLLSKQVSEVNEKSHINFIEIGNTFEGGHEIREISTACYYRMLIPWLIPQYDKIIYSDVDIIFRGSIADFYNQQLTEYVAGIDARFHTIPRMKKYVEKIGVDPYKYLNSGFLLINSKKQREHSLKDRYLELANRKFLFQDQDIINIVTDGDVKLCDRKYNIPPFNISPHGSIKLTDVVAIHYVGDKPWKTFTLYWREWWDVYDKSVFYNSTLCEEVSARALDRVLWLKNQWRKIKSKIFHK